MQCYQHYTKTASPNVEHTNIGANQLKTIQPILAITAAGFFTASAATPVRAQAQLLLPAACATGVGCVFVGTVIIAGVAYYVWQNRQTGQQYHMPIEDPEREMERMGQPQSETVTAGTRQRALERCQAIAGGRTLQEVRHFQGNQWECIFY